eukprot:g13059.t1
MNWSIGSKLPVKLSQTTQQSPMQALLRQKANALEEQLAAKERKLKEFEQQLQPEEIPGNIRSVPPALHGSLFLGPTLSGMDIAQRRALVIGCNYCNSFAALKGCANDAWNMNCLLRQSLQYPESQESVVASVLRPAETNDGRFGL